MAKAAATLRDVAEVAGLSVAAVSRHLNGKLALPPGTAARIGDAVAALGYKPNLHARRLSLGRSETIGLVVPDIANPFFALLADAAETEAAAHGLDLLLCATRNRPARELGDLARLRRDHMDGLLFVTNHADDGALAAAIDGLPVVLLDEDVAGAAAPKVFADNREGGRRAAQRLLASGHRRLAFLGGPPGLLSTGERHAGFAGVVAEAGAAIAFESFGEYTAQHGYVAGLRLLDGDATAAFATSDETALGLLRAAQERGVAVPRDLSVIGFDDVGPLHLLDPALTAIRQPVAEMGRQGVAALLSRIAGIPIPPEPVRLPVTLVERASVTAPRRRKILK